MIVKEKDSISGQIDQLEYLLQQQLIPSQKKQIETELKILRSGSKGENTSAYFLDFHFSETKNWAVIHDLRIELNGKVAQIDHLLINRFLEVYVLESKNYANGMKITEDGEFLIFYGRRAKAVESPIEQNERHIFLLQKFLKEHQDIFPKRLGLRLKPSFKSYIIVSPQSRVTRPAKNQFDTSSVIKSDKLYSMIQQEFDDATLQTAALISKIIGQDTLQKLAERIVEFHQPAATPDYRKRFGIESPVQSIQEQKSDYHSENKQELAEADTHPMTECPRCGSDLIERIAKKGANAGNKFLGCSTFPKCRFTQAI